MKKILFLALLSLLVGCSEMSDKAELKMKNGATKTVYGMNRGDTYVEYYETKEDKSGSKNKHVVPFADVEYIKELSDDK